MNTMDWGRMHPEVLKNVFDLLDFDELLGVSWTCSRWRRAARLHPTFWKRVTLDSNTQGAIEIFLLRLHHFDDAPLELFVDSGPLFNFQFEPAQSDRITTDILRVFSRVTFLAVNLGAFALAPMYATRWKLLLSMPAPRLVELRLDTHPKQCPAFELPFVFLADQAPLLRVASFTGIQFPRPTQYVLTGIRNVAIFRHEPLHDIAKMLVPFTEMEHLAIQAPELTGNVDVDPFWNGRCKIMIVDVLDGEGLVKLLRSRALVCSPLVMLKWYDNAVHQAAFESMIDPDGPAAFGPPYYLTVKEMPFFRAVSLSVSSAGSLRPPWPHAKEEVDSRIRTITGIPFHWHPFRRELQLLSGGLHVPDIVAHKITTITVALDLMLPLGLWLGPLPALVTVNLWLGVPHGPFGWRFAAPRIRTINIYPGMDKTEHISQSDVDYLKKRADPDGGKDKWRIHLNLCGGAKIGGDKSFAEELETVER